MKIIWLYENNMTLWLTIWLYDKQYDSMTNNMTLLQIIWLYDK